MESAKKQSQFKLVPSSSSGQALSNVEWSQTPAFGKPSPSLRDEAATQTADKEYDFKKQSQFAGGVNWRNVSNNNGLWRFWKMKAAKKQSQFKANRLPLAGNAKR